MKWSMPTLRLLADDRDDYGRTNWNVNWHLSDQLLIQTMNHHNDYWQAGKVTTDAPEHIQRQIYKPAKHGYPPLPEGMTPGKWVEPYKMPESQ